MESYIYEVELRPDEGGGYCVRVPDLPGCISEGDTIEEAVSMGADALKTFVASLIKHGDVIPSPVFGHETPEGGMVVAIYFETDASYIIDAVSPSEAAEMMGLSRGRISQMIKTGQLSAHRVDKNVWVDKASIAERIASSPRSGRPRKNAVAVK